MPLILVLFGILLVVTAVNNTTIPLFQSLVKDMPGFVPWGTSLVVIGSVGYISQYLKPFANMMFALVILLLILRHQDQNGSTGFFDGLTSALHIGQ